MLDNWNTEADMTQDTTTQQAEHPAKSKKSRVKMAQIVAESVNVLCPECGEPQPNPDDGSHIWTMEHFRRAGEIRRPCAACDEPLHIHVVSKVQFR